MNVAESSGKTEIKKYSVTVKTVVEGLGELNKLMKLLEKMEKKLKSFADHIWKVNQAFQAMKTAVNTVNTSVQTLQATLKSAGTQAGNLARRLTGVARAYGGILTAQGKLGRVRGRTGAGGGGSGTVINAATGAVVNVYNNGGPGGPGTGGKPKPKAKDPKELGYFGQAAFQAKELAKSTMFLVRAFRTLAVVAAGVATLLPAKQFADSARDVTRKSSYLGLSKGAYQQYDAIFQQFGAGEGDLEDFFGTLADRMKDVADGTGYVEDFKNMLGVTSKMLKNTDGSLKSSDELLEIFFAGVKKNATATERLAAVVRVLGDDVGRKLGPLIALGIDNLEDLKKEVYDLGLVFSDAELEIGNKFSWSLARLGMMAEGLWKRLGLKLSPAFQHFADVLDYLGRTDIPWLNSRLNDLGKKFEYVGAKIAGAIRSVDDLLKAGGMKGGLVESIAQLTEAAGAMLVIGTAMGTFFYPTIVAVTAAIGALWLAFEDFMIWGQGGESWIDWQLLAEGGRMLWSSLKDLAIAFVDLFAAVTGIDEGEGMQGFWQMMVDILGVVIQVTAAFATLTAKLVRLVAIGGDMGRTWLGGLFGMGSRSTIVDDRQMWNATATQQADANRAGRWSFLTQGDARLQAAMAGEDADAAARNRYGGRDKHGAGFVYNINNNVTVSGSNTPDDTAQDLLGLLPTSDY